MRGKLYMYGCILLLLGQLLGACSQKGEQHQESLPQEVESGETKLSSFITTTGIPLAQLGAMMIELDEILPEGTGFEDSLQSQGGYSWWTRTLVLEEGRITFEGEFIDEANYSEERLQSSKLNRIRLSTPEFETEKGIKVGSRLSDFASAMDGKEIFHTLLHDQKMVDFEDHEGHIHYLFELDNNSFEDILEQSNVLSVIPPDTKVKLIVVM